jgi:hypothetical protein
VSDQLDELARRVADRVRPGLAAELVEELRAPLMHMMADLVATTFGRQQPAARVGTSELASLLGVSAGYLRKHAIRLGGRKTSDGPRPRWSFDPDFALRMFEGHPIASDRIRRDSGDSLIRSDGLHGGHGNGSPGPGLHVRQ